MFVLVGFLMSWYYVDGSGQTKGPVALQVLKNAYQSKGINDNTYVWNGADVNQWTPLSNVPHVLKQLKPMNYPKPPSGGPSRGNGRRRGPPRGGRRSGGGASGGRRRRRGGLGGGMFILIILIPMRFSVFKRNKNRMK